MNTIKNNLHCNEKLVELTTIDHQQVNGGRFLWYGPYHLIYNLSGIGGGRTRA